MARKYALIETNMWWRPDFRALTCNSQLLYFAIRTMPELSRCGVSLLVPEAWAFPLNCPIEQIEASLDDLVYAQIVHLDEAAKELFIPDAIRHERLDKSPQILERVISDAQCVRSDALRALVCQELAQIDSPRAAEAVTWLEIGMVPPPNPKLRNKYATADRSELKRLRRRFCDSSARRRLRSEIAAGLHVCPCGQTENLQVDHIVPLAGGGTNDFSNLQVLCARCNNIKGARV